VTQHLRLSRNLCLLLLGTTALIAQTEHKTAFTGVWKLNLTKSSYESATAPQSQSLRFTDEGKNIISGVGRNGRPYEWEVPWSNGTEVVVKGRKGETAVQTIRGHTLDMVLKEAGKTVAKVHAVVSPDGKTQTGNITLIDEKGSSHRHVEFYERQ
jgi:hypothetical protein